MDHVLDGQNLSLISYLLAKSERGEMNSASTALLLPQPWVLLVIFLHSSPEQGDFYNRLFQLVTVLVALSRLSSFRD